MVETLALFGGTGNTGKSVVQYALDQGYKVRILVRTPSKVTTEHANLTVIEGDLSKDDKAVQETIQGADYVMSTAGSAPQYFGTKNDHMMLDFVKKLWPLMEQEKSIKVFLYQSGTLCPDLDGNSPTKIKFLRYVVGTLAGISHIIRDNESVAYFLKGKSDVTRPRWIIVRPGLLKEGEGGKVELEASEEPSGAMTFQDLATFNVKSLRNENLYGKSPYINPKK